MGPEPRMRLAETELRRWRSELQSALGQVLADAHARNMIPGILRADPLRNPAHDDDEFNLPVHVTRAAARPPPAGQVVQVGNFVNVLGAGGTPSPVSSAWSR